MKAQRCELKQRACTLQRCLDTCFFTAQSHTEKAVCGYCSIKHGEHNRQCDGADVPVRQVFSSFHLNVFLILTISNGPILHCCNQCCNVNLISFPIVVPFSPSVSLSLSLNLCRYPPIGAVFLTCSCRP